MRHDGGGSDEPEHMTHVDGLDDVTPLQGRRMLRCRGFFGVAVGLRDDAERHAPGEREIGQPRRTLTPNSRESRQPIHVGDRRSGPHGSNTPSWIQLGVCMYLAVARRWEVHCSVFTPRHETESRFMPRLP